jgi:hypothetical protein
MGEAHEEQADRLEREADSLEKGSEDVAAHVKEAREDWKSKKSSSQAPGAADPEDAAPGGLADDGDSAG